MCGVFPVLFCMPAFVASATYVAAYQTDPEVVGAVADAAEGGFAATEGMVGWVVGGCTCVGSGGECERGIGVSTNRTPASSPFLETVAVEDVLAGDGEEAGRIIHS